MTNPELEPDDDAAPLLELNRGPVALEDYGWNTERAQEFAAHFGDAADILPGRVAVRYKGQYAIVTREGEIAARIKGYLRYNATTWAELPVVGDWVAVRKKEHESLWRIQGILKRHTTLQRKVKGTKTSAQVLAANVTKAMIVMGLNEDYNPRRLERYLVLVHETGIQPIVLLNKADLLDAEYITESCEEIQEIAPGTQVMPLSALKGKGVEQVKSLITPQDCVVFVGSSGVGKSTLVNALMGTEVMATGATREDGRGRHTTTTRELMRLPAGGLLIDSPGVRELQLWVDDQSSEEGLSETFAEIEELASRCRFPDCQHRNEPNCAVLEALEEGDLSPSRYESFMAMKAELEKLRLREQDARRLGKSRAFRPKKGKRG
ncbi:MAG: ribosome small subunit-dependent GTPase A [Candidatus Sumerlaeia bacterium]|nr:ribosome small subunit-dependent GTPase A [Candidatus Sumerlaeia bacterium]